MPGLKRQRGRQVPTTVQIELYERWKSCLDDHTIALQWSPDGKWLAAATISGPISIFDGLTGQNQLHMPGHRLGTTGLDWHPHQPLLASSGQDGTVRVWDTTTGQEVHTFATGATSWADRVAWSPQGDLLAGAAGRTIRLWDTHGQLIHEWTDHPSTVVGIQWQPGGRRLAAAAYGGITLWSPDQATPLRRYEWKGSSLVLAWSPDSSIIATGDQDSTVHFWYVASGKDLQMWGYETKVLELAWHHSSRYLATGGGSVPCVWDCAGRKGPEGTKPVQLNAHTRPVRALAYQHQGDLLASGGTGGGIAIWQPHTTNKLLAWADGDTEVAQLGWSPDDRHLAVGRADGIIDVFAIGQGTR